MRVALLICLTACHLMAAESVIEEQLKKIGSVPNDEVVVVQKQFTTKHWRHELNPISFGGIPFGTVRRTLFGGASYTLHFNDWLAWEAFSFLYSRTFFSSFVDDINANQLAGSKLAVDYQKLIYFLTTGVQLTPTYGKMSTFSRWIAYLEPYLVLGAGYARTETSSYPVFCPGIGARFFFREWFSMRVELRDYIYTETFFNHSSGQNDQALRNNYSVMVALSFWLPKMPG
ncbi:MAG: outer membrane beta-barrel domain-containing protein [Deltaproteobacteria bacterium]|nr:outer membrane beta-barrel domain-containing protein [Deltaproteobacteria bacterium]MBI3296169.1 outer membrane beta-barrel domain-containing protein [Deltaproteobacteria bacterium]